MTIAVAAGTDVGRLRAVNQDAVHAATFRSGTRACVLVADGLGGHAAGEVASGLAVQLIGAAAERVLPGETRAGEDEAHTTLDLAAESTGAALRAAVEEAHDRIVTQASLDAALSGMGTVVVVAWLTSSGDGARPAHGAGLPGGEVLLAHAGDCRAYLRSGEEFRQLTADHSWVGEAVRAGRMTAEAARTDARRNVVTRSLGAQATVEVELTGPLTLRAGDRLLLCSDGLHGVVEDASMGRLLGEGSIAEAVQALIDAANAAGGPDNIGVAIAEVS